MRSFVLLTAAASVVLVSGAPSSASFEVQQSAAPPTHGSQALRNLARSYRKYGVPIKGRLAAAEFSGGNTTVGAVPVNNDYLYVSPLQIGGQTFNMQFDTGSNDLWVYSKLTPNAVRGNHSLYDPSKSAASKKLTNETFSITYGSGSVSGIVYSDTVSVGSITANNVAVDIPLNVSESFYSDSTFDGILGMGSGSNDSVTPTHQKTFFSLVLDSLAAPFFAVNFFYRAPGSISFGKLPAGFEDSDIAWINSTGGWSVFASEWSFGGNASNSKSLQLNPIFDTGSRNLFFPPAFCSDYYSAAADLGVSATYADDIGFVFDCNMTLPDVSISMGSNGEYVANIPGEILNAGPIDDTNTTCVSAIQPIGGPIAPPCIFGDTFLKTSLTLFKLDPITKQPSMGFAAKSATPQ